MLKVIACGELGGYLFLVGLAHFANAGGLYEVWQLEGRLLQASLPLQVLPLLAPVAWHRHSVPVRLHRVGFTRSAQPSHVPYEHPFVHQEHSFLSSSP